MFRAQATSVNVGDGVTDMVSTLLEMYFGAGKLVAAEASLKMLAQPWRGG